MEHTRLQHGFTPPAAPCDTSSSADLHDMGLFLPTPSYYPPAPGPVAALQSHAALP